jgi:hypothetical protein
MPISNNWHFNTYLPTLKVKKKGNILFELSEAFHYKYLKNNKHPQI